RDGRRRGRHRTGRAAVRGRRHLSFAPSSHYRGAMQLLGPGDPPPFSVHNEKGRASLLLLCDHASKAVPKSLSTLGITEAVLSQHVGWDIGGLDAAIELSRELDAPLVASGYSRLVIDCNRWPGGEGSTPEVSDTTRVPANKQLTREQVNARAAA